MKKNLKSCKYILCKPLSSKGNIGNIFSCCPGYGKYLERFGYAKRLTEEIQSKIEEKKNEWKKLEQKNLDSALALLEKVKTVDEIILNKKVSPNNSLYSAVKPEEIIAFFHAKNIMLALNHIKMNLHIKALGSYTITINVYADHSIEMPLHIVKEI